MRPPWTHQGHAGPGWSGKCDKSVPREGTGWPRAPMGGRHRPAIGRRPSAAPGPPAPGQGPRPNPTRMLRAPGPRAQTSFLVLPPLSLAAQGPPGLPAEPGCRVPAETYQGKESSPDSGEGSSKTRSAACVSSAQDPQGGRKSGRGRARPVPPPSFLYCDWKPEHRPPLPPARAILFKDKAPVRPRPPSAQLRRSPSGRWGGRDLC